MIVFFGLFFILFNSAFFNGDGNTFVCEHTLKKWKIAAEKENWRAILGINNNDSPDAEKQKIQALLKLVHPDKNRCNSDIANELFKILNEARCRFKTDDSCHNLWPSFFQSLKNEKELSGSIAIAFNILSVLQDSLSYEQKNDLYKDLVDKFFTEKGFSPVAFDGGCLFSRLKDFCVARHLLSEVKKYGYIGSNSVFVEKKNSAEEELQRLFLTKDLGALRSELESLSNEIVSNREWIIVYLKELDLLKKNKKNVAFRNSIELVIGLLNSILNFDRKETVFAGLNCKGFCRPQENAQKVLERVPVVGEDGYWRNDNGFSWAEDVEKAENSEEESLKKILSSLKVLKAKYFERPPGVVRICLNEFVKNEILPKFEELISGGELGDKSLNLVKFLKKKIDLSYSLSNSKLFPRAIELLYSTPWAKKLEHKFKIDPCKTLAKGCWLESHLETSEKVCQMCIDLDLPIENLDLLSDVYLYFFSNHIVGCISREKRISFVIQDGINCDPKKANYNNIIESNVVYYTEPLSINQSTLYTLSNILSLHYHFLKKYKELENKYPELFKSELLRLRKI